VLFVLPRGGGGDGVRILAIVGGYNGSFALCMAGSEAMIAIIARIFRKEFSR